MVLHFHYGLALLNIAWIIYSCFSRILIYRDGISDGNFPSARDEIASIRKAVFDKRGNECPNCSAGCVLCCPPISELMSIVSLRLSLNELENLTNA